MTQNVTDFLRSIEIEGILGNSDFVYLLSQSPQDQVVLAEKIHLSHEQLKYITDSEQGCGLIKFDKTVLPFSDRYPNKFWIWKEKRMNIHFLIRWKCEKKILLHKMR